MSDDLKQPRQGPKPINGLSLTPSDQRCAVCGKTKDGGPHYGQDKYGRSTEGTGRMPMIGLHIFNPVPPSTPVEKCPKCGNEGGDRWGCPYCGAEPSSPQPSAGEGPFTDNGKKMNDFQYKISGPGVDGEMLHLQIGVAKPEEAVLLLLNFGYAQGRLSLEGQLEVYRKSEQAKVAQAFEATKRVVELEAEVEGLVKALEEIIAIDTKDKGYYYGDSERKRIAESTLSDRKERT